MRIGVYVGSFDPVHKGHKKIIEHVSNLLDKLIVIPTNDYWDKKTNASLIDRIKMLKKYENDKVEISSTLNNYEYTYQVLNKLRELYPTDTLYLVIGADNLESFHLWKNVYEILKNNKVLVLGRNDIDMRSCLDKFMNKSNFIIDEDFEMINISSSEIRNNIIEYSEYVDEEILDYIMKNDIYNQSHN